MNLVKMKRNKKRQYARNLHNNLSKEKKDKKRQYAGKQCLSKRLKHFG